MSHCLNLADILIGIANANDVHPAIVAADRRLSYGELITRASRTARILRKEGVAPGDVIGIALSAQPETVVFLISLWMLNATAIVLDFRSRGEERSSICRSFGVKAVVEGRRPPGETRYASLMAGADWEERLAREPVDTFVPLAVEAPALISLTSGTTGAPQGIAVSHQAILFRNMVRDAAFEAQSGGRFVNPVPLHYSVSRNQTLGRLIDGGTVHFVSFLSTPQELAEHILSTEATVAFMVPTQLRGLLDLSAGRPGPMFPRLQTLACGGAPTTPEDNMRAFRELSPGYTVQYGSSLTGTIATLDGTDIIERSESVGKPVRLINLQIVDANGTPLPRGESGIIRLRTPGMSDGILGAAREDSDRLLDGWAYPGDLGLLDANGYLTLTGRASDMIIRGGANVFPAEVEVVLREHPAVREVAVVGFAMPGVGQEIAAFIIAESEVTGDELTGFARARLSPDKRPRVFRFVESLPRNAMGKILRRELVARLEDEAGPSQ